MWLIPHELEGVCPERKLAATVLIVALRDALGVIGTKEPSQRKEVLQAEAQLWIATDSPDLTFWTGMAGTTPTALRAFLCLCGNALQTTPLPSWILAPPVGGRASGPTAKRGKRGSKSKRSANEPSGV